MNTSWTPTGLPGLFDPKLHELHLSDALQTLGVKVPRPSPAMLDQPLLPLHAHEKHIASSSGQSILKDADTQHSYFPFRIGTDTGVTGGKKGGPGRQGLHLHPLKGPLRGRRTPREQKAVKPSQGRSSKERSIRSTESALQISRIPIGEQARRLLTCSDKALRASAARECTARLVYIHTGHEVAHKMPDVSCAQSFALREAQLDRLKSHGQSSTSNMSRDPA